MDAMNNNGFLNGEREGVAPRLLVSEREAARLLDISPRTLWSLRQRGEIAHVRRGRSVRYAVRDLEAWILRNTRGAAITIEREE
jgi:excisionase family DNA binding protein